MPILYACAINMAYSSCGKHKTTIYCVLASKEDTMIKVIKKDGTREDYNVEKVIAAISKSASRALITFNEEDLDRIRNFVNGEVKSLGLKEIPIPTMHNIVEKALESVDERVAKSYKDYRNYRQDFVKMLDTVYQKVQSIDFIGDRSNANTDSTLVSTKRCLGWNELNGEFYKKFFLMPEERQAMKEGYIYIHDRSARLDTYNCCLFDVAAVLSGGFELGNIKYTEPTTLAITFNVLGDVIMAAASQQYGGFTLPEVDKVLAPYAQKSYVKFCDEYKKIVKDFGSTLSEKELEEKTKEYAYNKVKRDFEQGFQALEYKLNTVGSSRGDYPFVTFTFGLGGGDFEKMATKAMLKVRAGGQGAPGFKKAVLFPKLVFLYDENVHGKGKELEDLFDAAVECSSKAQYPDYLSMSGEGYIASMYKKYGKVISPMGCRAFLSPYWERGGQHPADDKDVPVFVGRFNGGAITLNLPMIFMKAKTEGKDFYEVYHHYLEMIRHLHQRTKDFLSKLKAAKSPLAFMEGGLYKGHLKATDPIAPLLDYVTFSFGYTALNELQRLYNGKSIVEDGQFALEVMQYLNDYIAKIKEEDHILYAIYGTPAESLISLQVKQFRDMYGVIEGVSDKEYFTNSFHCHVGEHITPIQKQDLEKRFWELSNGGKITYTKYPIDYNIEALKAIIRRGMAMGFYQGVNMDKCYCEHCGYEQLDMVKCPKCGSEDITEVNRVCGYLGYSKVKGRSFMNDGKLAEIRDRVSM